MSNSLITPECRAIHRLSSGLHTYLFTPHLLRRFAMKKVPRPLPGPGLNRLDAERCIFGLKLSHCKDFIPISAASGAVKLLRMRLRIARFSPAGMIRQISAKMAVSQAIAYDKTFIHEKTKVIRLERHPA